MMSVVMVVGMNVMQYIVVGVGLIQRMPGIPGPWAHNPQKFIIFLDKDYKITGKILFFHNFNLLKYRKNYIKIEY